MAYLIYLANRDSSKGQALTLEHFLPTSPAPESKGQTTDEIVAMFEKLAKGMNRENH